MPTKYFYAAHALQGILSNPANTAMTVPEAVDLAVCHAYLLETKFDKYWKDNQGWNHDLEMPLQDASHASG